jgi:capsid protein
MNPLEFDRIKAKWVIHWFNKFRPGQVRGIPTFTSSLDLFVELRSYRKAVLGAAEIVADYAAVLEQDKTIGVVGDEDQDTEYQPFKKVQINRKMMTMLPPGAKLSQLDAKQPITTYEMFQEKCLGEACRPLSYPLNLALGTSQKFNFSSAKLDHVNYRGQLTVLRGDCNRVVLDPILKIWHEEAVLVGSVPVYNGVFDVPPHDWHWPGFTPLDPVVDATADHDRLAHGTETFRQFWAQRGHDWQDIFQQLAVEKTEMDRLGLEFGEPVRRSVTESVQSPDGAGEEATNVA